jgi:hypothetical protein
MQRNNYRATIAPASCHQGEALSTKTIKTQRRRLVDYTEYRSDGTKSRRNCSLARSISSVPICQSLNSTVVGLPLTTVETTTNEEEEEEENVESIEFFLKITPKHKRKNSRESTLDIIGGPNRILQQMISLVDDGERFPRPAVPPPFRRAQRKLITSMFFDSNI